MLPLTALRTQIKWILAVFIVIFTASVGFMYGTGGSRSNNERSGDFVVAKINGEELHISVFQQHLRSFIERNRIRDLSDKQMPLIYKAVLDEMVSNRAVIDEVNRLKISVPAEDVNKQLKQIESQYVTREQFMQVLRSQNSSLEQAKAEIARQLSIEKMLGDVAQGDKNRLQQLALVFGQISSAGKLQGQDLLQLINAGYNPLLDISELTGKSVAQLKDDMSKGLITFDMVRAAFQKATGEGGKFNNMTERIAQTSYGAFEQLKGKLISTLLELYNVIQPFIIPVLTALGKGLDYVAGVADWASQHLKILIPIFKYLTIGIAAYTVATNLATIATKALSLIFRVIITLSNLSPFGLIAAGVAALTVAIITCWNKFAGFRAVILTVWDTVKGFGEILKQYILDRITGIITGIGYVGDAIGKLFKGDFNGAWQSAKTGAAQISGVSAVASAAASARDLAAGVRGNYSARLDAENQKQAAKDTITKPEAAGGTGALLTPGAGAGGSGASAGATANAITTGGTRNTSIVLNIGKFFEDVNITNVEGRDYRELRDAVLESINRSLEIAVSAAR